MPTAPHCGIVCASVSIVPAFKCPGSGHSSEGQEFCSKTHKDFLDEATDQTLVENPLPLHFYPHNNHTSSLQTLLFQLLCVLRVYTEDPLLYGALMRPYPLKLYSSHVVFPFLNVFSSKWSCSICVEATSISMASQQWWSHTGHPLLTTLRLSFLQVSALALFLLPRRYSFESGTGQRGMWRHSSVTQMVHPHGHYRVHRRRGKEWEKGAVAYCRCLMRCWDFLTEAFKCIKEKTTFGVCRHCKREVMIRMWPQWPK